MEENSGGITVSALHGKKKRHDEAAEGEQKNEWP